ncbi:DUF3306 domain-containing protein [Massilia agilis]|uniref:DUF3306 domain-containing protein n=1 Tax=Massilia agilis TaxID=1811226 RepID=A0ABT2D799_9BURK|nr:DUF3306 domain-containing protein [Massilia agilis]MCS0806689.1 DUF3306 domain-containing protein [Massilia agilis]
MSKEGFLRRWSRLKSQGAPAEADSAGHAPCAPGGQAGATRQSADDAAAFDLPPVAQRDPHPPVVPRAPEPVPPPRLPTLDDVALLGPDSDFSVFMTQGVDKTVQRLAMKKLFSDPHFSIMDGLDVYIDDYTKSAPVSPGMLASLAHAKNLFARFASDDAKPGQGEPGAGPQGGQGGPNPPEQDDA